MDGRPRGGAGRILLLEQYFHPEGWGGAEIPREISIHFARRGWKVEVICGSDQYAEVEGSEAVDPASAGVVIRRVPPFPLGGGIRSRRGLRQAWFCARAFRWLFLRRPPDLFMAQTNPPAALPLIALAARLWRRPFVLVAMDLYPEVMVAGGAIPGAGVVARVAGELFGWAYRSATQVVALGPEMARRIAAKGVPPERLVEIGNWATGTPSAMRGPQNPLRGELGLAGRFVLVYSGNLGIGHEFETLLEGLRLARMEVPEVVLVFFGSGARLGEVKRTAAELGLGDAVRFHPLVPAERLPESLGLADLGIVTLREGFQGLMVPSKLLGYMARGIPVLYVGPTGDADALIRRHGFGFHARNGDPLGVADVILRSHRDSEALAILGEAGRRAYEGGLTREHALARYEAVVRAALAAVRGQA